MCKFHESTCNGFGDIRWTDNPIYFSSIDTSMVAILNVPVTQLCVLGKINKLWCLCAKFEHNFPVNACYKGSYGQKIWF